MTQGSTIHLVLRPAPRQNLEQPAAESSDFDDDLHILDPQTYYDKLNTLEQGVVERSEFFRCKGQYNLFDHKIEDLKDTQPLLQLIPAALQPYVALNDKFPPEVVELYFTADSLAVCTDLRKTYLVLCRVLQNLEILKAANFCTSYYSLLVRQPGRVARLVRIPEEYVHTLKITVESVLIRIIDGIIANSNVDQQALANIKQPCFQIYETLGLARPKALILASCRLIATMLDLGLVSYMGSHGSRFDLDFLGDSRENIVLRHDENIVLDCSLRPLACLNGFLDARKVWVFEDNAERVRAPSSRGLADALSILTRMEEFADVWGPVWSIPADGGKDDRIKQYNVSKGVIHPVGVTSSAVLCHWDSWGSFHQRQSNLLPQDKSISLIKDDLLLIGMRFRENTSCRYTLDDFESDFGSGMNSLGTSESSWAWESRGAGFSLSKVIGVSVQGTQKKIPETSMKQHMIGKWTSNPTRANPKVLNHFLGVEISHCTGNARRITLKNLLLLKAVRPILDRQIPRWDTTTWGEAFLRALESENPNDIVNVWKQFSDKRPEMADLVCSALEVLDRTGLKGGIFQAAFLHKDEELSIELDQRWNDWSKILRDSHKTAIYAVVNERCIECHTPDHVAAECDEKLGFSALSTSVGIPGGLIPRRIEVNGESLKITDVIAKDGKDVLIATPASGFTLSHRTVATELSDPTLQGSERYQLFIRATTQGYNGMKRQRVRNSVPHSGNTQSRTTRVVSEVAPVAEANLSMEGQTPYASAPEVCSGDRTTELSGIHTRPTEANERTRSSRDTTANSDVPPRTLATTFRASAHNQTFNENDFIPDDVFDKDDYILFDDYGGDVYDNAGNLIVRGLRGSQDVSSNVNVEPRREVRNDNSTVQYEGPVHVESGRLTPRDAPTNQSASRVPVEPQLPRRDLDRRSPSISHATDTPSSSRSGHPSPCQVVNPGFPAATNTNRSSAGGQPQAHSRQSAQVNQTNGSYQPAVSSSSESRSQPTNHSHHGTQVVAQNAESTGDRELKLASAYTGIDVQALVSRLGSVEQDLAYLQRTLDQKNSEISDLKRCLREVGLLTG